MPAQVAAVSTTPMQEISTRMRKRSSADWKEPTRVIASETKPAMPGRPSEAKKAIVDSAQ